MRIVHVASEMYPLIKTGGLADVVGALATTLAARDHEVSVYLPAYRPLLDALPAGLVARAGRQVVRLGSADLVADLYRLTTEAGVTIHLIGRDEYFDRSQLYWNGERDYDDNDARFIFFAKAVIEHLRGQDGPADVVHAHDWQAGLVPVLLRHAEQRSGVHLARRTVFTVHNLIYQGLFPRASFALTNLHESLNAMDGIEFYGRISTLKAGLMYADTVTTVSPTYAREIATPEHGAGLEGVIRLRNGAVRGIRNGIDARIWNPAADPLIPAQFGPADLSGKIACRRHLCSRFGWPADFVGPIFVIVSRLTEAKGHGLLQQVLARFARTPGRLVVTGTGDAALAGSYRGFAATHGGFMAFVEGYDEALSHELIAGADFFLMPSLTEPCGLTQMYAQNYGTIPVASRVGGLVDTIVDLDERPADGTGLLGTPDAKGLWRGIERAHRLFNDAPHLADVQQRGMRRDFSWDSVVGEYESLYRE